jgi:hypothetical protein
VLGKLAAGALVAIGVTMGCGMLSIIGGPHSVAAIIGGFVISSVAPIGAGVWLWRSLRRRAKAQLSAEDDAARARVLRLAAGRGGSLTLVEVVAHTGWATDRVEGLLDGLCRQGIAEHRVAEDGTLVYRVRLLGAAEKGRAQDVLERG